MQSTAPAVTQRGKGSQREALLAQWLERAAVNRKVTGSIPVGSAFVLFPLFFLWRECAGRAFAFSQIFKLDVQVQKKCEVIPWSSLSIR